MASRLMSVQSDPTSYHATPFSSSCLHHDPMPLIDASCHGSLPRATRRDYSLPVTVDPSSATIKEPPVTHSPERRSMPYPFPNHPEQHSGVCFPTVTSHRLPSPGRHLHCHVLTNSRLQPRDIVAAREEENNSKLRLKIGTDFHYVLNVKGSSPAEADTRMILLKNEIEEHAAKCSAKSEKMREEFTKEEHQLIMVEKEAEELLKFTLSDFSGGGRGIRAR
ncbi:hypothetical protein ZIOFF_002099 [Zingiber officinale]|uniref:Uncharacterized protein n=1 Tax=Zingiber officinale TaxID=94328 RepID=A0A8J5I4K0_ZINOF|nr:hypothetical protein ZIOFF_002099 [Zingiber officinale]